MPEVSEEAKAMISQFQTYQQQLQSILIQKESLKLQMLEIERALEELEKTKEEKGFKIVGPLMISKSVKELKDELNENKENIQLRIKSLEKTEEKINIKLKELQTKLKGMIK